MRRAVLRGDNPGQAHMLARKLEISSRKSWQKACFLRVLRRVLTNLSAVSQETQGLAQGSFATASGFSIPSNCLIVL